MRFVLAFLIHSFVLFLLCILLYLYIGYTLQVSLGLTLWNVWLVGCISLVTSFSTVFMNEHKNTAKARLILAGGIFVVAVCITLFFNVPVLLEEEFLFSSSIFNIDQDEYFLFFENQPRNLIEGFRFSVSPQEALFSKLYGLRQEDLLPYYQAFYAPLFDYYAIIDTSIHPFSLEAKIVPLLGPFIGLVSIHYYYTIPFILGIFIAPLKNLPAYNFISLFWWFIFYLIIRFMLKYFDVHEQELLSIVVVGAYFCCGAVIGLNRYLKERKRTKLSEGEAVHDRAVPSFN